MTNRVVLTQGVSASTRQYSTDGSHRQTGWFGGPECDIRLDWAFSHG